MGALFERPAFLVLILLVLLLFGAKRLPDLARGVGRSLRIFKAETDGLQDRQCGADDDRDPRGHGARPPHPPPAPHRAGRRPTLPATSSTRSRASRCSRSR